MLARFLCLFCLVVAAGSNYAHAHLPLETTITVGDAESGREISVVMAEPIARALLTPAPAGQLAGEVFEQNRSRLQDVAARVCVLLDASGAVLAPASVQVALNPDGEVSFLIAPKADAPPAKLRADFLNSVPPAAFVTLTDRSIAPPRRAVLMRGQITYELTSSATLTPDAP